MKTPKLRYLRYLTISCLSFLVTATLCTVSAETFDRQAMLENLAYNVILPQYESFIKATQELELSAEAFTQEPTEEALIALQGSWKKAVISWQGSNLFSVGDLRNMVIHNQISKSINTENIESNISSTAEINEAYIEGQGSSSKGLLALEYLLFSENGNEEVLALLASAQRKAYVLALAQNVHLKSQELLAYWAEDEGNFVEAFINANDDGSSVQSSVNKLANQMMAYTEKLTNWKLARPLGYRNNNVLQLSIVEGARSETATAQIRANLNVLLKTLTGAQGLGFDDYLDSVDAVHGSLPLSKQMTESIYSALDALESVDKPLTVVMQENPERVEQVYNATKSLLILTGVDMASQLGITITFSDNDGD